MQSNNRGLHPLILLGLVGIFLFSAGGNAFSQYKIMPLGNSITAGIAGSSTPGGFRDDLASMLTNEGINFDFVGSLSDGSGFDADHEGHNGRTTAYVNANVEAWLASSNPEFVLLHIGTNDISTGAELTTISENISSSIDKIHNHNNSINIILSTLIPRKDNKDSLTTELNKLFQDVFYNKKNAGYPIYFAGHNDVFKATPNWQTILMSGSDIVHPNDNGYNLMAEVYFNALMNAINSAGPNVTDNFNRTELGPAWIANPEFQIVSNELANTSTDDGWNYLAIYAAQTNPTQASIKWGVGANPAGINEGGLALQLDRTATNANGYLALIRSNGDINLWSLQNGIPNTQIQRLAGTAGAPAAGDEFRVVMSSDGAGHHFKFYLNGEYSGEMLDPQKLQGNSSSRYAGVMLRGNFNNNVDDFNLFKEGDVTAPTPIIDLAAVGQATGSITLQWTTPGDDGDQGTASSYEIRYSKGPITNENFSEATLASDSPNPDPPATIQTFVVSGLSANTSYYFAIKTSDEVPNVSELSNVVSATTISALLSIDDFERQTLGPNWSTDPEFQIQNGELVNTSMNPVWDYLAVYKSKKNPVEVWIRWSETTDTEGIGRGGLALMLSSPSPNANGYLAWMRPNDKKISLFKLTLGVPEHAIGTKLWDGPFPQAGDIFKVTVTSEENGHHFDYYLNDQYLTRISDPDKKYGNEEELYAGVMLHGGKNNNVEEFGVANRVGAPSQLEYISGNNQTARVWQPLPDSFIVRVIDDDSNPIQGVPIKFEVTEGGGNLDLASGPDDNIRIQAERGNLIPPMQIFIDDPAASNGQYICAPTGDPRDGRAVYSIYIKEPGNYRVWGRVKPTHSQGTSFFFVMDNGQEITWDIIKSSSWAWDLVSDRGNGTPNRPETDPIIFTLEAGLHTFSILERWYGTCIDHIIFTKDPDFTPSDKEEYDEYVTDDRGFASALLTLGSIAGTNIVEASAPSLSVPPIVFTATGVAASPDSLNYISGNGQTGVGGEQLPEAFVVRITDSFGNAVSNIPVMFTANQGNGSFSTPQPTYTNESGEASTYYTMGTSSTLNQVVATSDSIPGAQILFSASASGGIAHSMRESSGNNQIGTVAQRLTNPLVVEILNESGEPVRNHPVQFAITQGDGSFYNESETQIDVPTDSQGLAEAWLVLGRTIDSTKVEASSNGAEGPLVDSPIIFTAVSIADEPTALKPVSGNNQTGAAGSPLYKPLVMKVVDQYDNPKSGFPVTFTVKAGGGNIEGENSKTVYTESDGTTFIIYTLGPKANETNRVEASALVDGKPLNGSPFTFEFVSGEVQTISYVDGNQQKGSAGLPLPKSFKVMIQDNFGNPVPNYDVHFKITQGDGTFDGAIDTTVQTNFEGVAQLTLTLGLTIGGNFEAQASAYKFGVPLQGNPITFTATAARPSQLVYVSGDGQSGEAGAVLPEPLRVKVLDENGNGIKGQSVHFEVTGGGGYFSDKRLMDYITGEGGIVDAIFTLGQTPGDSNQTARASALYQGNPLEGSPITFYASARLGSAKKLVTVTNYLTGVVGNPLSEPFKVQVTDIAGNPIANHSVNFSIIEGGGSFAVKTDTVTTGEDGIASIILTLGPIAGDTNNVIQATATLNDQHLQGSPAILKASARSSAAANLQLVSGNAQIGIAGTPLSKPFSVTVTDTRGNGVSDHPVTFLVKGGGGHLNGTVETSKTMNTNKQGIASTILTLGPEAGIPNVVQAFSTNGPDSLNGSPVTFSANSKPGPVSATTSTIVCQPTETLADGETISIITVTLMDSFKNPITNKFITLSATGTGHTLEQPQTQTSSDGVAVGSIRSTKAETKIITARDVTDNLDLAAKCQLRFTALDAYQINLISGNAQVGNVGTALPEKLTVQVTDKNQNPIFHHEVRFFVTAGGGYIFEAQPVYTDSSGMAVVTLILGEEPGFANTVEARAPDLVNSPITFMANGVNGTASRIELVSGNNQTAMSGTILPQPFVSRILDSDGHYIARFPITYKVELGNGHFTNEKEVTIETDEFGLVKVNFTLDKEIGTNLVKAYANGLAGSPVSFIANGSAGKASVLKLASGDEQSGLVNGYLPEPLRVQVTDYNGNGVAIQELTFVVVEGDASIIESQPRLSDAHGFASSSIRFGTGSGRVVVEASGGNLVHSPVQFSLTAEPLQATSMKIHSGNNQSGTIGRELVYPLAVEVNDTHGNAVSGVEITFAVIEGNGALLDAQSTQSDRNGIAWNRLQLGPSKGINTVYAIRTGLDHSPLMFRSTGVANKFPLFEAISDTTISELERLTVKVKATDDDGENVNYGVRNLPRGAEFDSLNTRVFSWTPDYAQAGRHVVTFMAYDTHGGFDAADMLIQVSNVNRKPKIIAHLPSQVDFIAPKHDTIAFSVVVSDPDQDPIRYKWYRHFNAEKLMVSTSPSYEFVSDEYPAGHYSVQVWVNDGTDSTSMLWNMTWTSVQLSSFAAEVIPFKGIELNWQTRMELNNRGFNIYRGRTKDGKYKRINPESVASNKTGKYRFVDVNVKAGLTYYYKLEDIDANGRRTLHKPILVKMVQPKKFVLHQNYPNPFNPVTRLTYQLPLRTKIRLTIYNIMGQAIRVLVNEKQDAGYYTILWDGKDDFGTPVASGVYLYRITTEKFTKTKRMILLK